MVAWATGVIPKRTFVWFAEEDLAFLKALEKHLVPLCHTLPFDIWHSGMTLPGLPVAEERAVHQESATLYLILVSADLLASREFQDEASIAFERRDRGEASVVPIVVRPCDWRSTALSEVEPLPRGGVPVGTPNNDAAWLAVVEGLREVLEPIVP